MDDDPSRTDRIRGDPAERPSIEAKITEIARIGIVGLFAYWSLTLIAPFAIILVWAGILAVALYPAYAALAAMLGARPRLAAGLITLVCLVVIAGPLAAIAISFAEGVQSLLVKLKDGSLLVPAPPGGVRDWPLIGGCIHAAWSTASSNLEAVLRQFEPSLLQVGSKVLGKIASIGVDLLSFVVSVLVAGFLFGSGERLADTA